ncbi:MAG: vitamin K epoxide reductase family protein [Solirubrobacterales bacterium]|nr:vitamin K epoxide reductase family protein [Solirubrobacterales bacterium]
MIAAPSSRALRNAMLVLTVAGLGVASYLTYVHYSGTPPVCTAGNSCLQVQTSVYSKLAGVPVALIGLLGYVAILFSLLLPDREESRFATAALTLVGFGFSAYLTGRELFSIHAICEWCVSSAVIMTILLILSIWRFLRGEDLASRPATGRLAGGAGAREPAGPSAPAALSRQSPAKP